VIIEGAKRCWHKRIDLLLFSKDVLRSVLIKDNRNTVTVKRPLEEIPEIGRFVLEQQGIPAAGGIII
jgi:hypothetical protein